MPLCEKDLGLAGDPGEKARLLLDLPIRAGLRRLAEFQPAAG